MWACRILAQILSIQGRSYEALQQFNLVVSTEPLDAEAYATMAVLASDINRQEDALRYYTLASDHQGSYPADLTAIPRSLTLSRLAILQERSGLYVQSVDNLTKCVSIDNTRLDLYLLLGRSLYLSRMFEEAEQVVVTVLTSAPDCLEANVLAAAICARAGRGEDATAFRRVAAGLDPTGNRLAELEPGPVTSAAIVPNVPRIPRPRIPAEPQVQQPSEAKRKPSFLMRSVSSSSREPTPSPTTVGQHTRAEPDRVETVARIAVREHYREGSYSAVTANVEREAVPVVTEKSTARTETAAASEAGLSNVEGASGAGADTDLSDVTLAERAGAATSVGKSYRHTPSSLQGDEPDDKLESLTQDSAEVETLSSQRDDTESSEPEQVNLDEESQFFSENVEGRIEAEPSDTQTVGAEVRNAVQEVQAMDEILIATDTTSGEQFAQMGEARVGEAAPELTETSAEDKIKPFPNFEEWFRQNVLDVVDAQFGSPTEPPEVEGASREDNPADEPILSTPIEDPESSATLAAETSKVDEQNEQESAEADIDDAKPEPAVVGASVEGRSSIEATEEGRRPDDPQIEQLASNRASQREAEIHDPTPEHPIEIQPPAVSGPPTSSTKTGVNHETETAAVANGHGAIGTVGPSEREPEHIGSASRGESDPRAGRPSRTRGRRWAPPRFERRHPDEPIRSALADLAEKVEHEPLNNGSRFDLAQALESADPSQAVAQYAIIVATRDPRLVSSVRERLEALVASGATVHGLQRLIGDVCMQQGAFERAIEAYSLAFDELRSRQIIDRKKRG